MIILVGDKNHPEVIGINGWCDNNAFIVLTEEDVNNLPYSSDCVCVFSQTTMKPESMKRFTKLLRKSLQTR